MILSHIINRLSKPLLITPQYHKILCDIVRKHIDSRRLDMPVEPDMPDDGNDCEPYDLMPGVRVIPIHGPIGYRVSMMEKVCGICDVGDLRESFDEAINDESVETVVFDINSPGGEISQIAEFSDAIVAGSKKKNCVAFTDTMACSAAQWISAACNEVYATPSADMGSIGVYCQLFDVSEAYKNMGVKSELFTSGDLKAIGAEGESLTDKQREYLQNEINRLGVKFRTFIKSRIPNIQDEDMQGQSIAGEVMYNKGYITGLVSSIYDIFQN